MITLEKLEKYLQDKVFPKLEAGRPDWDKPHTQAVVDHLKNILQNSPKLNLDEHVLLIAAYTHDLGYRCGKSNRAVRRTVLQLSNPKTKS